MYSDVRAIYIIMYMYTCTCRYTWTRRYCYRPSSSESRRSVHDKYLTSVEDSPYTRRLQLDESHTSLRSDVSGSNIQLSMDQDSCRVTPHNGDSETGVTSRTNKRSKRKRNSRATKETRLTDPAVKQRENNSSEYDDGLGQSLDNPGYCED